MADVKLNKTPAPSVPVPPLSGENWVQPRAPLPPLGESPLVPQGGSLPVLLRIQTQDGLSAPLAQDPATGALLIKVLPPSGPYTRWLGVHNSDPVSGMNGGDTYSKPNSGPYDLYMWDGVGTWVKIN